MMALQVQRITKATKSGEQQLRGCGLGVRGKADGMPLYASYEQQAVHQRFVMG